MAQLFVGSSGRPRSGPQSRRRDRSFSPPPKKRLDPPAISPQLRVLVPPHRVDPHHAPPPSESNIVPRRGAREQQPARPFLRRATDPTPSQMDDFSTTDRLRALLTPLACCLPTCRLVRSPSSESLNNDHGRAWYDQSRPEAPLAENNVPGNWEDAEARATRREADLLSLHEAVGGGPAARRRWRGRGGDISGSGHGGGELLYLSYCVRGGGWF